MAKKIIKARLKQRTDTQANWAANNPVLLEGELGLVTDDKNLYKVGDGVTAWNDLPFRGFDGTLVHETGDSDSAAMSQRGVTQALDKLKERMVEKVPGKGLSTEDYTTEEKEKLAGLQNFNDAEIQAKLAELSANLDKIDSDAIHIADAYGNIILTIDAEGIKTTDVETKSGKMSKVISAIIEGLATKLGQEIDSDFFQVQDANGNIAFRIDSEGVHTPKSDSWIVSMILGETYIPTSTQRDENGDVQSAEIVYPDGNKGSITITSRESNGVTAMVIGYKDRMVSVTMERDSQGNVNKINIA